GVEVVGDLGLLPEERDVEACRAPAGRDVRQQVGDLALIGEAGLGPLQLGAERAMLATRRVPRVGLGAALVELSATLRDLLAHLAEVALPRPIPVRPVEKAE